MRSKELIRGVLYINSSLVVQKNHTEQVRFSNQAPRPSKALGSLREDPFQRSLISYSAHAGVAGLGWTPGLGVSFKLSGFKFITI